MLSLTFYWAFNKKNTVITSSHVEVMVHMWNTELEKIDENRDNNAYSVPFHNVKQGEGDKLP